MLVIIIIIDAGPQPQVVSPSTDSVDSGIPAPNTNSSTAAPAPIDSGLSATDTSLCTATPVGSGLSACNTSLYITSPDSCETVDIIDRKIDGESSDEAENADKEGKLTHSCYFSHTDITCIHIANLIMY